jgi:hypothetical protein
VRRPSALILSLALVASALFAGGFSGASAITPVAIAHPGGDDGNLSTIPATYNVGDQVELYANFASDQSGRTVTYYRETPAGSNDYSSVGTATANSNGNAYLKNYTVSAAQKIWARSSTGRVTEIQTLTPTVPGPVTPDGSVTGSLAATPTAYAKGDTIQLGANFASGTFPVEFYGEGPADTWNKLATIQSNSSGNAYFKTYAVNGTQRVFARKTNNERTEIDTITPSPKVTLDILRDCTGNDCGSTATAFGVLDPVAENVPVTLQYQSGSSWNTIGSPVNTGVNGKVSIQFSLSGLSQWSTRTYRLVAGSGTSSTIKFMPGPTQLGQNVLHVDVDKGVYPGDDGNDYTGEATLRVGGVEKTIDAKLEKFGVRGSSTASYTKKPYKLKFDKAPNDVFGMKKDKSWTLLANYLDQSAMRDKVGLDLGRRLTSSIPWTPDSRYVEMFVNDQYVGAYLMTESVKIDDDRVNVNPATGMIMETDGNSVADSSLGFKSTLGKIAFAFKDPDERKTLAGGGADPEGVTSQKLTDVKNRVNLFESKLYSSSTRNQYATYLDVSSTVDFYLIKEFTKDNDSDFYRSNYFWWDPVNGDNKFHFGPAWDFDRSAGNVDPDTTGHKFVNSPTGWYVRGTGTKSDSGRVNYSTQWFAQLFKTTGSASFLALVEARWQVVKAEFEKTWTTDTAANKAAIGVGAANDRARWANEPKRYATHGSGYDGEVAYLTKWYKDRYNWMNGELS